jgi:hypothetical protein
MSTLILFGFMFVAICVLGIWLKTPSGRKWMQEN